MNELEWEGERQKKRKRRKQNPPINNTKELYQILTLYTLKYAMLYVNCISIKLKKK